MGKSMKEALKTANDKGRGNTTIKTEINFMASGNKIKNNQENIFSFLARYSKGNSKMVKSALDL